MKGLRFFTHSDGTKSIYPERIPQGWEYVITPEFTTFWRKIPV